MKKTGAMIGILLMVGLMSVPLFAHGPRWEQRAGYTYCQGCQALTDSNLTDEQLSQLRELSASFRQEIAALRDQLWEKRGALAEVMRSAEPDAQQARALQREISQLRARMDEARIEHDLKAKKVSPEWQPRQVYNNRGGRGGNCRYL